MKQHTIPKCYLSSFTDPSTPINQDPYVWILDRDTKESRKKSPKNILVEKDFYTIELNDGGKDYRIETSLAMIESTFISLLRKKIIKHIPINNNEYINLALFFAALFLRTKSQKEHWEKTYGELAELVGHMEKVHDIEPKESKRIRDFIPDSHKERLVETLELQTKIVLLKKPGFYVAPGDASFITSDRPYMYLNPEFDEPSFFPAPPVADSTNLLVPLTPDIIFYGLGKKDYDNQYYDAKEEWVKALNHKIANHCDKYIYSSKKTPDFLNEADYKEIGRECGITTKKNNK